MKILIATHYMEMGGAETALLGLLESLASLNHEIDLWVWDKRGPLMNHIPKYVRIIDSPTAYSLVERPLIEAFKKSFKRVFLPRVLARVNFWIWKCFHKEVKGNSSLYSFLDKELSRKMPRLDSLPHYDCLLAFNGFPRTVAANIEAKEKIGWIHTDYSRISINEKLEKETWNLYDKIACVSEEAKKVFVARMPYLVSKTVVIPNHLPLQYIHEMAKRPLGYDVEDNGRIKLLTIGRFCEAKRIDAIPKICHEIVKEGIDIEWWIIGYGDEEEQIRKTIDREDIQDRVKLLGYKENPYPYIRKCDLYVQPSLYEGCSVAVQEAQALGKKVVITNYPTAGSQINDCKDGWIVPIDIYDCAKGITKIIRQEISK